MAIETKNALEHWEETFIKYFSSIEFNDHSHDIFHFKRVWKVAQELSENEPVDLLVILASCYFHDVISLEKNDPNRHLASTMAAEKAAETLRVLKFPEHKIEHVCECIRSHSFSADIAPKTEEAKIVQDADRMEALGALGVARCFYTAGRMQSELFHSEDPLGEYRELNDKQYALDHFKVKLLKLPETMQTGKGQKLATARAKVLIDFTHQLISEL